MKKVIFIFLILCFLTTSVEARIAIVKYKSDGSLIWQKHHAYKDNYTVYYSWIDQFLIYYPLQNILTWGNDFILLINEQGLAKWLLPIYVEYAVLDSSENIYAIANELNCLLRISSEGKIVWEQDFFQQYLTGLFVSEQDEIYTASSLIEERNRGMLYKFSTDGQLYWKKEFASDNHESMTIYKIDKDINNNIYVYYYYENDNDAGENKFYTKLDKDGNILWTYNQEECFGEEQKIDEEGNLYSLCSYSDNESWLFKINYDGELEWSLPLEDAEVYYFDQAANGNFIAVERDRSKKAKKLYIIDNDGNILINRNILQSEDYLFLYGFVIDSSNNMIFHGCKMDWRFFCKEFFTAKYDEEGNYLWSHTNDIGTMAIDAAVDEDDNIYVVGDVEDKDEEEEDSGCGCGYY